MSLFTLTLILFVIMDPIGNISSFERVMMGVSTERKRFVLFREMLIALCTALLFNVIGEGFFIALNLSETAVRLASGVVMFLIAMGLLFPKDLVEEESKEEPWIFPLAIPMISGPALIATVMLFAHIEDGWLRMNLAIGIAWSLSLLIFFFAHPIRRLLTDSGVTALERLMGMILFLLAVQRFMEGVALFIHNSP